MYRHIKEYEIKNTDADVYDNLKLSSLLSFLEESACLSADELDFGYDEIAPKNVGFIIVNWFISLEKPIKLGDRLTVHTWPLKPKHLIFLRDYELFVGSEKVGVATARWCMIDLKSFAMLPANKVFKEGFFEGYNTERSVDFNNWKIPQADGAEKIYERRAAYSDCDHYFHVNNTKYADFLLDVFSVEEFARRTLRTAQITYAKQCKEGELLEFFKECKDGGYLIEGKVGGELRVQLKVQFNEL